MKNKKKIILTRAVAGALVGVTVFTTILSLSACGSKKTTTAKNKSSDSTETESEATDSEYSNGLTDSGFYTTLTADTEMIPDFSTWTHSLEEVIEWGTKNYYHFDSVEECLEDYAKSFLYFYRLDEDEIAQEGDSVSVNIELTFGDGSTSTESETYTATASGNEVEKLLVGKKLDDTDLTASFTIDDSAEEHAGETAEGKLTITHISVADPLSQENIDKYKDSISTYAGATVTDKDSCLEAMKPIIAQTMATDYTASLLQEEESIEVPEEYIDLEQSRLKSRLLTLGYTFEEYLSQTGKSEEDIRIACKNLARENCIVMQMAMRDGYSVSFDDIKKDYGESFETVETLQGIGYLSLNKMRDHYVSDITKQINWEGFSILSDDTEED